MQGILALFSAAACVALGALASRRLSARAQLLGTWDNALLRLSAAVAQGRDALPTLLRKGAGDKIAPLQAAADLMEKEPALDGPALFQRLTLDPLLTAGEKEILKEAVVSLFSPTQEGQQTGLSGAMAQWEPCRAEARIAWEKNGRLYRSLGWLAGAAVFILMC